MFKGDKINTLLQFALCLLAFSIPTKFIVSSICLALVAILWVLQGNLKETFTRIKNRPSIWLWFLLYILLIISYFYSEDKTQASFDLKVKLAYLILPIIVGAGVNVIDKKVAERIYISLIAGVTLVAIVSLIEATIIWYPDHYYFAFFYHDLVSSFDPNAVYMAWYTIFSIALLLFLPWEYHFKKSKKGLKTILISFLVIFFFLLSARMFMLLFLLFVIPYFLKRMFAKMKRGIIVTIITIVSLFALFQVIDNTNNPIRTRYYSIIHSNTDYAWLDDYSWVEESRFDNATIRLFLWRLGVESIRDRNAWWTGVGNGDVHVVLKEKMHALKVQNVDNPDESKRPGFYNSNLHNMYLQTLVMIGITGLLVFLLIVFMPVFYIHKMKPYQPFLVFHITSILFMMQEAVLQTQAGIFFYILFSSMFWGMFYNEKQIVKK